jgi:hypothetical protein
LDLTPLVILLNLLDSILNLINFGENNMNRLIKMITAVSLLLVLAGLPVYAVVPDIDAPGIERAMAVQEANTERLMAIDGVVGTAVGADAGGRAVIRVLTKQPGVAGLPKTLEGFQVVPMVTGEIFARKGPPGGGGGVDPTARFDRPVPIGVSTGHPDITAGTIGARVTDGVDVYALSNNHVYAASNAASIGDAVIQPGTFDGGSSIDNIGTLDDFETIVFCNPYPTSCPSNTIDAAIASTTAAYVGFRTPSDGYGAPSSSTATASVGMRVMKYGRTTGQTNGRIYAINATVDVNYGLPGFARFVNQIIITPGSFSAGGDSGSLIVVQKGSDERKPVGLLFAGSNTLTIANPIDPVLDRFGVEVDGN